MLGHYYSTVSGLRKEARGRRPPSYGLLPRAGLLPLATATKPTVPTVTTRATGTFDVKLTPQANDTPAEGSPLGRLTIDKQFHGDLDGTSKGEMLTAGSPTIKNSAGYVAVERVTGTLHGKQGTLALQHTGVMTRGEGALTIAVVPDSGTGELTGISGTMDIDMSKGNHAYTFDYTIAGT